MNKQHIPLYLSLKTYIKWIVHFNFRTETSTIQTSGKMRNSSISEGTKSGDTLSHRERMYQIFQY